MFELYDNCKPSLVLDMPPLAQVVNRVEVLFLGHEPIVLQSADSQGEQPE